MRNMFATRYTAGRMLRAALAFSAVLSAGVCHSQSMGGSVSDLPEIRGPRSAPIKPVPVCDELGQAVEAGVKEMAYYNDAALGTPEAELTNRRLSMVAEASRVQSNLLLMQANRCAMPKQAINPRAYLQAAFACVHRSPKSSSSYIPECDRAKWTRSTE